MTEKEQPLSAVWQNGGFSAKLSLSNSTNFCSKFELWYFLIPTHRMQSQKTSVAGIGNDPTNRQFEQKWQFQRIKTN
jgi:hypothetical protein